MKSVSSSVINRLPRYYRYLSELLKNNIVRISSRELSLRMNVTASQIRQDLNCFGGFGQQGYGYNVKQLHSEISNILGLNNNYTAILIGAGNIGRAFAGNINFDTRGFKLIGIFDVDNEKIGRKINGLEITDYSHIQEFLKNNKVDLAIIAVPRAHMQSVANELIDLGIKGFLNFSYAELSAKSGIMVENVHLGDSLMRMSFKISGRDKSDGENED